MTPQEPKKPLAADVGPPAAHPLAVWGMLQTGQPNPRPKAKRRSDAEQTQDARRADVRRVLWMPAGKGLLGSAFDRWAHRGRRVKYVGKGPFANPFTVDLLADSPRSRRQAQSQCVMLYQRWIRALAVTAIHAHITPATSERWSEFEARRQVLIVELRQLYKHLDAGGVLGCDCKPDESCHADVLINLWRERWFEGKGDDE